MHMLLSYDAPLWQGHGIDMAGHGFYTKSEVLDMIRHNTSHILKHPTTVTVVFPRMA